MTASRNEPKLMKAARLILEEHNDLIDSAPRGTLWRLEQIADELQRIEDHL